MAKIYVSSTFVDLQECRERVSKMLRQMGNEDMAMEYYVAEDKRPDATYPTNYPSIITLIYLLPMGLKESYSRYLTRQEGEASRQYANGREVSLESASGFV